MWIDRTSDFFSYYYFGRSHNDRYTRKWTYFKHSIRCAKSMGYFIAPLMRSCSCHVIKLNEQHEIVWWQRRQQHKKKLNTKMDSYLIDERRFYLEPWAIYVSNCPAVALNLLSISVVRFYYIYVHQLTVSVVPMIIWCFIFLCVFNRPEHIFCISLQPICRIAPKHRAWVSCYHAIITNNEYVCACARNYLYCYPPFELKNRAKMKKRTQKYMGQGFLQQFQRFGGESSNVFTHEFQLCCGASFTWARWLLFPQSNQFLPDTLVFVVVMITIC